jgi:hypothetical protein
MNKKVSTIQDFLKLKQEAEKTFIVNLPSGLVVEMKKPGIKKLIFEGLIPDEILNFAIRASGKKIDVNDLTDQTLLNKFYDAARKIALHSIVNPKVKEGSSDESAIGVDDIDPMDLFSIFSNLEKEQLATTGEKVGVEKTKTKEFLKKKKVTS